MPNQRITDDEFLAILRACRGLYAKRARAIEEQYDIKYSRNSVRVRAKKFPKEVADIEMERVERAVENVDDFLDHDDPKIRAWIMTTQRSGPT